MTTQRSGSANRSAKSKSLVLSVIGCAALLISIPAIAPARAAWGNPQEPKYEMGTFYMCLLIKPPNLSAGMANQPLLQSHLKHVMELISTGKAAIVGPFGDDTRIAGLFVLNAAEEARAWEETDPLVKTGGFSVEVLKWWAAKGIMKPPAQPFKQATYYFGFLKHGPKWTAERTPETDKLQAAHMANINAMAKTGKLVIAGPFENGGDYAGVYVFKVGSLDEAKALAESDPAIRAGRLIAELHPWLVPEGSLP
jgi:uncharacterized protein